MSTTSDGGFPAPSTLPPLSRSRRSLPLGVAILSFLVGLYGFLVAVFGLLVIVGVTLSSSSFTSVGAFSRFGVHGLALGVLVFVIGLIILGIGVALWRLRLWALVLGLLFLLLELVTYALAGDYVSFGFIASLVIFVYLIAVNRHFR